ncbi:hypothetical protein J6590_097331 [Homalodisca vitripennis]|nr:hypothetical protein J6590_097331 [Homalodisca vitripennis]
MSAGRLRHDDEDLGDFVNRILEEPASTGTEPVGVEEEDNSEFDDNGSESSELFGDMDPEYLPSEDSSEDSDNDMNTLDQRQLVHNQLIQQQPNPHPQPDNGIQQANQNIEPNYLALTWGNTNQNNLSSFEFNALPLISQEIRDKIEGASPFEVYNQVFVDNSFFTEIAL